MSNKLNKKEQVLNQLAEKVKKGELSENMDWHWGCNEFICFTDWLNYVRTGKGGNVAWNWNEREDTTWTLTTTNCQTNNCQYGIEGVWIDSFLVYAFPHVGCQVKNDSVNNRNQEVDNSSTISFQARFGSGGYYTTNDGKPYYLFWIEGEKDKSFQINPEHSVFKGLTNFWKTPENNSQYLPVKIIIKKADGGKELFEKEDFIRIEEIKKTMANNLTKEIKELIQQIETEYQKGIDYKSINLSKETGIEHIIQIHSPKLKNICRRRFNFPSSDNYHLDYEEGDQEGNDFFYRLGINNNDYDFLSYGGKHLYRNNGIEKPKKCKSCGEITFYENGRIVEWDGEKINSEPSPNVIGHFHVECAKKYFGNKEQPEENILPRKENNPPQSSTNSPNLEKDLIKLLLQYFQEKKIKSIKLDNNELVIAYDDGQLVKKPNNSQELQKINDYFQKNNKQELTRQELNSMVNANNTNAPSKEPKSNNALLVVGGIGILVVGLIVGILISKRKSKKVS